MPTPGYRPTESIRDLLKELAAGELLRVDVHNILWLRDRALTQGTRTVLMRERLVTRLDKTKAAETHGNGFVISDRGRKILES